jgi:hypothetical protein
MEEEWEEKKIRISRKRRIHDLREISGGDYKTSGRRRFPSKRIAK